MSPRAPAELIADLVDASSRLPAELIAELVAKRDR